MPNTKEDIKIKYIRGDLSEPQALSVIDLETLNLSENFSPEFLMKQYYWTVLRDLKISRDEYRQLNPTEKSRFEACDLTPNTDFIAKPECVGQFISSLLPDTGTSKKQHRHLSESDGDENMDEFPLDIEFETTAEIVVELDEEVLTTTTKRSLPQKVIHGLSKDAFIKYALEKTTENTQETMSDYWDCLMGIPKPSKPLHCYPYLLSETAAEKLLEYKRLFQYGLNVDYLPSGFVLVNNHIIHYDQECLTDDPLIAPKLLPPPTTLDLSEDEISRQWQEMAQYFIPVCLNFSSPQHKKALIQVYCRGGIAALNQFYERWIKLDPEICAELLSTLYKDIPSFVPFLENNRIQEAFSKLAGIKQNPAKYSWFLKLLEQHAASVGYDDLPALVDAFQAFSRSIEEFHLEFYAPIFFKGTKSLPTTLGRMLSIIKNCRPEDRQAVWMTITKLRLSSDGPVYFQRKGHDSNAQSFVIPEMDDDPEYLNASPVRQNFYKNVAKKSISLPVEWYRQIDESISTSKNFTEGDKTLLYQILQYSTTGRACYELCKNPTKGADYWNTFIQELITIDEGLPNFSALSMAVRFFKSKIISTSLDFLSSEAGKPNIEILITLVRLIKGKLPHIIENFSVSDPEGSFSELTVLFKRLTTLLYLPETPVDDTPPPDNSSFYLSMICYTPEDYATLINNRSLFEVHLDITERLSGHLQSIRKNYNPYHIMNAVIDQTITSLIGIISHFHLNATPERISEITQFVEEIIQKSLTNSNPFNAIDSLNLFWSMNVKAERKLTAEDLINFLEYINENATNKDVGLLAKEYVKTHFKDCFSTEFFASSNHGLKQLIRENIPDNLQPKAETLLPRFPDTYVSPENWMQCLQCVPLLKETLINLDKKAENFLDILIENFPTDALDYPNAWKDFHDLLSFFQNKGQKEITELTFFFDKITQQSRTIQLLPSIGQYFGSVLPSLDVRDPASLTYKQLAIDLLMNPQCPTEEVAWYLDQIKHILTAYSEAKELLVPLLKHYSKNDYTQLEQLSLQLLALNDLNTVRSLCCHFMAEAKKTSQFTPEALWQLLEDTKNNKNQIFFLKLFARLLDKKKATNIQELTMLMANCSENDELFEAVEQVYNTIPYPSLEQVNQWIATSKESSQNSAGYIKTQQALFDKKPCERENPQNGFDIEKARKKRLKMGGNVSINETDLRRLERATEQAKDLSTQDIQKILRDFREDPNKLDPEELIALVAELLYRVNGQPAEMDEKGERILGRSFEINTTQYLALYAMLKSGKHVTSEIPTGQGKSRIMMLASACQWLQGNTVDFITADLQLATRDYLLYKGFFDALGAKTELIHQNTPPENYLLDGINFSDSYNLNLARNKAKSAGRGDEILQKDSKKRALMLDEAHRLYYDLFDTRCNYSVLANPLIRDVPWVYEYLIKFFSQDNEDIRHANHKKIDNREYEDSFFKFVIGEEFVQQKIAQLKLIMELLPEQLITWQKSALIALSLKFEEQFEIEPDVDIQTSKGTRITSKTNLVINDDENFYAKYAHGVHECLNARLNWLKHNPEKIKNEALKQALSGCTQDFYIDSQKKIIYSTTSQCMLDDYEDGILYGVTATSGSIHEIEEARRMYPGKGETEMQFISIPSEQDLQREDFPLYLTSNETAQYALIVQQIEESQKNQQPILLFCENDTESRKLMTHLEKIFQEKNKTNKFLHRITAKTRLKEETDHVDNVAGQPGMVTVCTSKLSQGKDIRLHGTAKEKGLRVLITHLPRERKWKQMIGRSGRMGATGDSRIILSKAHHKDQFKKKTLTDGFYTATDAYIQQQQAIMDRQDQVKRLIKLTAFNYRHQFTQAYFEQFLKEAIEKDKRPEHIQDLYDIWADFFDATDKKWLSCWQSIQKEIDYEQPNVNKIQAKFSLYKTAVDKEWLSLQAALSKKLLANSEPLKKLKECSELDLNLPPTVQKLLATFDPHKDIPLKPTTVYKKYDPAHDGRHVFYEKSFEKTRAWLRGERGLFADFNAWRQDRGILFPSLQALFKGYISLREFITGEPTIVASTVAQTAITITTTATISAALGSSPVPPSLPIENISPPQPQPETSSQESLLRRPSNEISPENTSSQNNTEFTANSRRLYT